VDAVVNELSEARREMARLRHVAARADKLRREAELRLASERAQNERLTAQIVALRNTVSWRLTRPIRTVRRARALLSGR
jgi:hypothetical protein